MNTTARAAATLALLLAAGAAIGQSVPMLELTDGAEIRQAIEAGEFTRAENLLRARIDDPAAPATAPAAIQLELLRRTRHDFALDATELLAQIRRTIPDATAADIDRWRDAGALDYRRIDGQIRYFRRAAGNLPRFSPEARARRTPRPSSSDGFDLTAHIAELVQRAAGSATPEIYPVRHRVRYELTVNADHPRLRPGAVIRAWLPYPQEYRQQRDVQLVRAEPPGARIAPPDAPQRSICFEQTLGDPPAAPRFAVEFTFTTSAYCPDLDLARVQPYDRDSSLYREFTAERAPHIVFSPQVRALASEIVGDEQNPLERARRVFRWVSRNVPWCGEMEYSIIPSLSAKGITARRGDCGVQGMTFITLCRAAGVPARWQSGWQTKPGDWNMHDWSEFYVEPWGWLPADASYGLRDSDDPRVRDFLCGSLDPYRLIVNLDYARDLHPPTTGYRAEPNDFQRGEVEIDGHILYFDEWDWRFQIETTPLDP